MAGRAPSIEVGPDGKKLYPAGEVMRRGKVSRQQIYQYTAIGLIQAASRTRHGYRLYPEQVFNELRVIRGLNAMGYSLRDIKEIFFKRED